MFSADLSPKIMTIACATDALLPFRKTSIHMGFTLNIAERYKIPVWAARLSSTLIVYLLKPRLIVAAFPLASRTVSRRVC